MSPNFRPIVFGLKIRTRGSQPSISVPIFSLFTKMVSKHLFCSYEENEQRLEERYCAGFLAHRQTAWQTLGHLAHRRLQPTHFSVLSHLRSSQLSLGHDGSADLRPAPPAFAAGVFCGSWPRVRECLL